MSRRARFPALVCAAGVLGCGDLFKSAPDAALPPLPDIHANVMVPDASLADGPADAGAPLRLPVFVLDNGKAVEVKRAGSDQWVELKIGDAVMVGDSVRATAGGEAEIGFDFGHMRIKEGTDVTLKILDARILRAQVNGRAEADVGDGGQLLLEAAGTDAVLATDGGRVSLFADGRGGTSVASLDGTAVLAGAGNSQHLKAGEFSTAKGTGLSKPAKIPKLIALKVSWPPDADPDKETNKSVITVHGKVSAFSEVIVQGKPAAQRADGTFSADVPLRKGKQRVTVAAKDVLGRRKAEARVVTMDPDAPDIKGTVRY